MGMNHTKNANSRSDWKRFARYTGTVTLHKNQKLAFAENDRAKSAHHEVVQHVTGFKIKLSSDHSEVFILNLKRRAVFK